MANGLSSRGHCQWQRYGHFMWQVTPGTVGGDGEDGEMNRLAGVGETPTPRRDMGARWPGEGRAGLPGEGPAM